MLNFLLELDTRLFLFFNAYLTHPILDKLMPSMTEFYFWIIPGIIAVVLFIHKKRKEALIVIGLAIITVALSDPISSQILKKLFARPRPCFPGPLFQVSGGNFLLDTKSGLNSFPSSHAMNVFAQAMLWSSFYPKKSIFFFAFAILIGYTRVYCGVHYPFDILAGAMFGCIVGWGVYKGFKSINNRFNLLRY